MMLDTAWEPDEDLDGGHAAASRLLAEELLSDDAAERFGQQGSDLRLLVAGKDVDDAVDGFRRAVRVQRAEHQRSHAGRRQRQADGLQISHFAHEHHVGVLPRGASQGRREGVGVHADLPVADDGFDVLVHELDGVLDGQDVSRMRRLM